jgi:hypothetical protein
MRIRAFAPLPISFSICTHCCSIHETLLLYCCFCTVPLVFDNPVYVAGHHGGTDNLWRAASRNSIIGIFTNPYNCLYYMAFGIDIQVGYFIYGQKDSFRRFNKMDKKQKTLNK